MRAYRLILVVSVIVTASATAIGGAGSVPFNITGGTGRFEGATGSYVFFLTATPLPDRPGFATEARIDGEISF